MLIVKKLESYTVIYYLPVLALGEFLLVKGFEEIMSSWLWIFHLVFVVQSQTYCIWGRLGETSFINGEYEYESMYNGNPYYIRSGCPETGLVGTLYLLYENARWIISAGLASQGYTRYAVCMGATTNAYPSCSVDWLVLESNSYITDSEIHVQSGSCPKWDCNGITVSGSSSSICDGTFLPVPGVRNAFERSNVYIFFANRIPNWVCTTVLQSDECIITQIEASGNNGWDDLAPSDPIYSPGGDLGDIQCLPFTTLPPTNVPSKSPSQDPSFNPSESPSKYPTSSRFTMFSFTNEPSHNPSDSPSISTGNGRDSASSTTTFPSEPAIDAVVNSTSLNQDQDSVSDLTTSTYDIISTTHHTGGQSDHITIIIVSIAIGFCVFVCIGSLCVLYRKRKRTEHTRNHRQNDTNKIQPALENVMSASVMSTDVQKKHNMAWENSNPLYQDHSHVPNMKHNNHGSEYYRNKYLVEQVHIDKTNPMHGNLMEGNYDTNGMSLPETTKGHKGWIDWNTNTKTITGYEQDPGDV